MTPAASRRPPAQPRLELTPLIDMVFILLIFFMVTSSFVKESGVDVSRPEAETATTRETANIIITVTADGDIWMRERVAAAEVRARVERLHAENPGGAVVIVADERTDTGVTVEVLDEARLAGAARVSIAATRPSGGDPGAPR